MDWQVWARNVMTPRDFVSSASGEDPLRAGESKKIRQCLPQSSRYLDSYS
jgi:hypothetical protein